MRYVSTRGSAPALDFESVTLAGLATDGGLYVPEKWPSLSHEEIAGMGGLSYVETAVRVMAPFVGDALDDMDGGDTTGEGSQRRGNADIALVAPIMSRHFHLPESTVQ